MVVLSSYRDMDHARWEALIRNSKTGTWFQSPAAYAFYASLPELFVPYVFALMNDGQLRGVCVAYLTREASALKQWFTRRAIIVGGATLADDCSELEAEELMAAVRQQLQDKAIYIEARNLNDYSPWHQAFRRAGFCYQPHLNFHINCADRETMNALMSDVRHRQLKKAVRSGATIKSEGISESEIREFYDILSELYRTKVKTPLFPLEFFLAFYRNGVGKYLLVMYEGKVIGGIMCPVLKDRTIYEWYVCGLDNEYRDQYPSVMATFAAMDYAAANDLNRFDVMGAGQPDVPYGVRDFKSEFGGQLVEHGRFLCVCKPLFYRLGVMVVRALKRR